jgi:L-2-aminoadipate reductase
MMRGIWAGILPNAPSPIPLDESFFDLGGHSILATRLVFEIRNVFVVNAPLGLVFDQPTIAGLAVEIDALRNSDLGLAYKGGRLPQVSSASQLAASGVRDAKKLTAAPIEYAQDYVNLLPQLQDSYSALPSDFNSRPLTVFLTGATGFLGAFVLRDLLSRQNEVKNVICLVRAPGAQQGLCRLREALTDRGVWNEEWIESRRLEVITGDLSHELFGLSQDQWARVASEADVVLHNGALVRDCFLYYLLVTLKIDYCRSIGSIHTKSFDLQTSSRPSLQWSLLQPASRNLSSSFPRPQPLTQNTMCNCLLPCHTGKVTTKESQKVTT